MSIRPPAHDRPRRPDMKQLLRIIIMGPLLLVIVPLVWAFSWLLNMPKEERNDAISELVQFLLHGAPTT